MSFPEWNRKALVTRQWVEESRLIADFVVCREAELYQVFVTM
jgi:hypothetical protein